MEEQRRAVSEFVRELSEPTQRGRLARWEQGVCPGVAGLPLEHGTYLAERIATEARAVGLAVGGPGCRPDILILVTNRAAEAAAEFRTRYPRYFASALQRERLEAGEGGEALEAFLQTARPIRAWHVSKLATSDGRRVSRVEIIKGVPIHAVGTTAASRLASNWKEDLSRALVIVDTTGLKGITYEQLAGYLAMVSLAQLDPEAEPRTLASIMTVFADRDAGRVPPQRLTEWDRAYLKGLYRAPANSRSLHTQRGAIRRDVLESARR